MNYSIGLKFSVKAYHDVLLAKEEEFELKLEALISDDESSLLMGKNSHGLWLNIEFISYDTAKGEVLALYSFSYGPIGNLNVKCKKLPQAH